MARSRRGSAFTQGRGTAASSGTDSETGLTKLAEFNLAPVDKLREGWARLHAVQQDSWTWTWTWRGARSRPRMPGGGGVCRSLTSAGRWLKMNSLAVGCGLS